MNKIPVIRLLFYYTFGSPKLGHVHTIVKLFYYFIDFKLKESHKFISSNYNCQVLPSLN